MSCGDSRGYALRECVVLLPCAMIRCWNLDLRLYLWSCVSTVRLDVGNAECRGVWCGFCESQGVDFLPSHRLVQVVVVLSVDVSVSLMLIACR